MRPHDFRRRKKTKTPKILTSTVLIDLLKLTRDHELTWIISISSYFYDLLHDALQGAAIDQSERHSAFSVKYELECNVCMSLYDKKYIEASFKRTEPPR